MSVEAWRAAVADRDATIKLLRAEVADRDVTINRAWGALDRRGDLLDRTLNERNERDATIERARALCDDGRYFIAAHELHAALEPTS